MNKKEASIGAILSIASGAISVVFMFLGGNVLVQKNVPFWIVAFASITCIYALSSIFVLSWAWRGGGIKSAFTMKIIAITYLALFFLFSLNVAMISGLRIDGIIIVSIALWLNWYAVNKVSNWRFLNA